MKNASKCGKTVNKILIMSSLFVKTRPSLVTKEGRSNLSVPYF